MNNEARTLPIICITGPMAAGKNLVSDIFEANGWACVDADKVAHLALKQLESEIIQLHSVAAEKLNISLKNPDGSLNRKAIGKIVFSDPEALAKHEALIHPATEKLLIDFVNNHKNQPVGINATVLYKTPNLLARCNAIVFVNAPKILRMYRIKKRDKLSFLQILLRFRSQKNIFAKYKKSNADIYKVWNIGNSYALKRKIERILLIWNKKGLYGLLQQ